MFIRAFALATAVGSLVVTTSISCEARMKLREVLLIPGAVSTIRMSSSFEMVSKALTMPK